MVRFNNIITRTGSKQNDIKYFQHLLPTRNIKYIVEPFGGSFQVIKQFYRDCNMYNFHINDLDKCLYYTYKNYDKFIFIDKFMTEYKNDNPNLISKDYINVLKNKMNELEYATEIQTYIVYRIIIKGCMVKINKTNNYDPNETKILNSARFTNIDYIDVMEEYKDNENAFIFLDPPYLFSDNSSYNPQRLDTDMTDIIIKIKHYMDTSKCKIMLVINKLAILEWIFKDYIKGDYDKTYILSRKKNVHLIICNY